jgi:hypothetical protein
VARTHRARIAARLWVVTTTLTGHPVMPDRILAGDVADAVGGRVVAVARGR